MEPSGSAGLCSDKQLNVGTAGPVASWWASTTGEGVDSTLGQLEDPVRIPGEVILIPGPSQDVSGLPTGVTIYL